MDIKIDRGRSGLRSCAHAATAIAEPLEARRFLSAVPGTIDTSFGTHGLTFLSAEAPIDIETVAATALPGGKTLLLGSAFGSISDTHPILARLSADGTPDSTFGNDGVLVNSGSSRRPLPTINMPTSIAVDSQGRIYIAGNNAVARLTSSGLPDYSFGVRGVAVLDLYIDAIVVAPDGHVFVGGSRVERTNSSNRYDFAIARLSTDGRLDFGFGTHGFATTRFRSRSAHLNATVHSLMLQSDGRILAAGGDDGFMEIVRFHADGSLDNSFGVNGGVRLRAAAPGSDTAASSPGSPWFASLAVRQSDGAIFAAGGYPEGAQALGGALYVAEYSSAGRPVTAFGNNGIVSAGFGDGSTAMATGVTPLTDGQLLVSGFADVQGLGEILLARLDADGLADATFGTALPAASGELATGVKLRSIFVAEPRAGGGSDLASPRWTSPPLLTRNGGLIIPLEGGPQGTAIDQFTAIRINSDGSLDRHYGREGWAVATVDHSLSTTPFAPLVSADGSIDVQYTAIDSFDNISSVAELSSNGAITRSVTPPYPFGTIVAVQPDGRILAEDSTASGDNLELSLARYNANGSIDPTFGVNGLVDLSSTGGIAKLLIAPGGQLIADVVADTTAHTLYSITPAGSISSTQSLPNVPLFAPSDDSDITFTPDGKVMVAATFDPGGNPFAQSSVELLRLNVDDLSVDTTFGNAGTLVLPTGELGLSNPLVVSAVAIDASEKIILSLLKDAAASTYAIVRLTAGGDADTTFGTNGVVTLMPGSEVGAGNLFVESDDKVIVWQHRDGGIDSIIRLNADGSTDAVFGDASSPNLPAPTGIALQESSGGEKLLISGFITGTGETDPNTLEPVSPQGYVGRVNLS